MFSPFVVLLLLAEGGFTGLTPETDSTSQGDTFKEALANLCEATELFVEEFPTAAWGRPLVTTFSLMPTNLCGPGNN